MAVTAPRTSARKARRSLSVGYIGLSVLGAVVGLLFLIPLWWTFINSLRPSADTFAFLDPLQWRTLFTLTPKFDNYTALFSSNLGAATLNSILVSAVTVLVGLVICSTAAFALAAIPFRGRSVVFVLIVISFLIPFDAIAIPLANLFRNWNLVNTYAGLILPGLGNGMAIFLLRTFFLAVPTELVEAARLDGLGWWGIFRRLYLPLSVPALIGAGLTLFLFQWQSYVWPLLVGTDSQHMLAPIALANLQGQHTVDYGVLFAGSMVLTLIPLVIIIAFQRYFVQSASTSGIK
ncbi:carbohydrate ABC transporter permease [Streptosporangium sp. 'caverna']|uniref:carbohydrate ABC transporter permease n=1 Tax=Streptosporangium sp. 'caverna' TaxID=2202249 RepID=UPI000D7E0A24|nr:carbohydrate ABC transporter permease [Streptosporangium sp. 'caverna']AWS46121.1 carbohydrate ABC transporter permease [Streptosporangium sp. 'caverna']